MHKTTRFWPAEEEAHIKASWVFDGKILCWARKANGGKKVGDPVGVSVRKSGHENVYLQVNGKLRGYVLARIVWFLTHGVQAKGVVEHADCNPKNNCPSNLRLATQSQNMANTRVGRTGNTEKGVYQDRRNGKWHFQVCKESKVSGGYGFKTREAAYAARMKKATELFGEFAR